HFVNRPPVAHHIFHDLFAPIGEIVLSREPGESLCVDRFQLAAEFVSRRGGSAVQSLSLLNVVGEDIGRLARERVRALENQDWVCRVWPQENFRISGKPFANPCAHGSLHCPRDSGVGREVSSSSLLGSTLPNGEIYA